MLRGYDQHRYAFMPCGNHTWNEVRRTRAGIAQYGGDLAGRFVEPLRHVNAGSFVTDGNESDAVLLEFRKHRIDLGARQPENELDSFVGEAPDQKLSAREFSHCSPPISCVQQGYMIIILEA
jgi:hypothetical protein